MANIDFSKIKTYSLKNRPSKVKAGDFALIGKKGAKFVDFYEGLPNILAAQDFKSVVHAVVAARKIKKPVIFMLGAHVIKCGLSPLIIDLINKDIVTAIALNGAGVIHDVEIAMVGYTSEDVVDGLSDGSFGMAKETADFINGATKDAARKNIGLGFCIGQAINKAGFKHKDLSIFAAANPYDK